MIDWNLLRTEAIEAAQNAWAPYSKLRVGAAGLTTDGAIVSGCNVENASFGLTLCAECGLVSDLHRRSAGRLLALSARSADGDCLMPCGRCRQLILEAGGPTVLIDAEPEPLALAELLPHAFGPADLP